MHSQSCPVRIAPVAAAPAAAAQECYYATDLKVPLVTPGRLDAVTQEVYSLLGLRTMVVVSTEHGDATFTVLRNHLVAARNAIEAHFAPEGPAAGLAARVTSEPLGALKVPVYRPRAAPDLTEMYWALGLDTFVLEHEGAQYTVLSDAAEQAQEALALGAPACAEPSCVAAGAEACCARANARASALAPVPRRVYPAPGLRLKEYYVGEPPLVIRTLARLFGVGFARLVDDAGNVYWAPLGPNLEATVRRLGICA